MLPGRAAGQVAAGLALAARLGPRAELAVQSAGQDPGRGRLAAAARTGEQVGVVDPVVGQRPLQRLGDVLLPDDVGEGVRPVAPVEGQRRLGPAGGRARLAEQRLILRVFDRLLEQGFVHGMHLMPALGQFSKLLRDRLGSPMWTWTGFCSMPTE